MSNGGGAEFSTEMGIGKSEWLVLFEDSKLDYQLRCVGRFVEWNSVLNTLFKKSLVREWKERTL